MYLGRKATPHLLACEQSTSVSALDKLRFHLSYASVAVIEEHKDKRNGLYSPDAKDVSQGLPLP